MDSMDDPSDFLEELLASFRVQCMQQYRASIVGTSSGSGSGSVVGASSGSGSVLGTSSGSGSVTVVGTASSSGFVAGTSSGSDCVAATSNGSGSMTGTSSGLSGPGSVTGTLSGSGSVAGTSSVLRSGSVNVVRSNQPVVDSCNQKRAFTAVKSVARPPTRRKCDHVSATVMYALCKKTNAGCILAHCMLLIDGVIGKAELGLLVYKVGITMDPEARWEFYKAEGQFVKMLVLAKGPSAQMGMLEAALISHFKHAHAQGLQNEALGGENCALERPEPIYCYVVYKYLPARPPVA